MVRYPVKATKLEVLEFIRRRRIVTIMDLIDQFGYRYWGARRRLYRFNKEGLVEPFQEDFDEVPYDQVRWGITETGINKLAYYGKIK